jgi:hypothetical protein
MAMVLTSVKAVFGLPSKSFRLNISRMEASARPPLSSANFLSPDSNKSGPLKFRNLAYDSISGYSAASAGAMAGGIIAPLLVVPSSLKCSL